MTASLSARLRFVLGILILLLSCALQFWFASAGVFVNFVLAALIVFAFFFGIGELAVFILAAIFILNWQPAVSADIVVFAVIPVAAFAFHRAFRVNPWIAAPGAIVAGFALLYLAVAPAALFAGGELFLRDLFGGLVFGMLAFIALERLDFA